MLTEDSILEVTQQMRLYGQLRLGAMDSESASFLGPFESHAHEFPDCEQQALDKRTSYASAGTPHSIEGGDVEREWDYEAGEFRYVRK